MKIKMLVFIFCRNYGAIVEEKAVLVRRSKKPVAGDGLSIACEAEDESWNDSGKTGVSERVERRCVLQFVREKWGPTAR